MEDRVKGKSVFGRAVVFGVVLVCALCPAAFGQPWDGNGVEGDPYQIWTAEDMQAIGADSNYWDAHFLLCANIDLSTYTGTSFNIIGEWNTEFTGVFDGNGHTISNFTYNSSETYDIGLFVVVEGAEIKNLGVVNPSIIHTGMADAIGALVGRTGEGGVIITDCYVEGGSISAGEFVDFMGGLAGFVQGGGAVVNCYSSATVSATEGNYAGGLIGAIERSTVSNCYSTGSVSGGSVVGGLVGASLWMPYTPFHKITNCYATGSVSGIGGAGGLIGQNSNVSIFNCYSTGGVSGTTDVGGLVGSGDADLVFNSYWDTQTSWQPTSAGGMPRTTAQMKDASTYAWWGCDGDWTIDDGVDYPHLAWEDAPVEMMKLGKIIKEKMAKCAAKKKSEKRRDGYCER
jgi:hypothetical protein